jgi:hypothetical protein
MRAGTGRTARTGGTRGKFAHGNAANTGHQLLGLFGFTLGAGECFIGVRRNDFFKNGAAFFAFVLVDRHGKFSFFLKYIKIHRGNCPYLFWEFKAGKELFLQYDIVAGKRRYNGFTAD